MLEVRKMREKTNCFLTSNVEILGEFLEYLWKTPIKIKEKIIHQQENHFFIDFVISEIKIIRMQIKIQRTSKNMTIRIKYTLHCNQDFDQYEACLFLSFCYQCPDELELCNQYGLYQKEDIEELESLNDINQIYSYQKAKNLLGNNQIFIFNMDRIEEHCADKALDQILQDFDRAIKNTYYED